MKKFYPDRVVDIFSEVTNEYLIENNIKGLILDVDNTLVTYEEPEPTKEVINWIDGIKASNIKVCIVSNGRKERVEMFNKYLKLPAVYEAGKPLNKGFEEAMGVMGVNAENTAIMGDQIFTDIYGGNRLNMITIYVKPISLNEIIPIKAKRLLEKLVFVAYNKKIKK